MGSEFENKLAKYAEVIVKVGLNVQAGQRLMIGSPFFGMDGTPVQAYPLVRHISRAAYQVGAKYVAVNWDDEGLQRIRVEHAAPDSFDEYPLWKKDSALEYIDNGDPLLILIGQNPNLLNGLDKEKVRAKRAVEVPYEHERRIHFAKNRMGTSAIVSPSITSWASVVFPEQTPDEATASLWEAIFEACRINYDDPIAEWERHVKALAKYSDYLTTKQYETLHYTAPGTDLTVGLPSGHIWKSGQSSTAQGVKYVANIPTEEVFTMPHRERVNGVVAATKPLNFGGLIEDFSLEFVNGRVVKATAAQGQEALDTLLNTDEGSRYLGEVALVPHGSPISQTGILFYNTLFDENASNHFALGNAYPSTITGGGQMSHDELLAAGANRSVAHADFMMGSGEMNIDGITADGDREPVMRNGEWAFEV